MEGAITDDSRSELLRAAVARVGREEMKAALALTSDPGFAAPKAVGNALNALRRHRDPVEAVVRAPYRAALPYVAAAIADACLARTIEVLGDHSDDPTREQLVDALDDVRGSFSDAVVAVMLASVADGGMPASDLCFDILAGDERFGLAHRSAAPDAEAHKPVARIDRAVTPEQREARRLRKQGDAEERRRKAQAARKAGDQVRRVRRQERARRPADPAPGTERAGSAGAGSVPRLTRRAALTPAQEDEFDRADPWTAGVVFAWVPFDGPGPTEPGPGDPGVEGPSLGGKARPCVVVAGSATHLLVRGGYSDGGSKSRDWKSVPLRHWKGAGFDRPTWIDTAFLRVPRGQTTEPVGWLTPEDWNALW